MTKETSFTKILLWTLSLFVLVFVASALYLHLYPTVPNDNGMPKKMKTVNHPVTVTSLPVESQNTAAELATSALLLANTSPIIPKKSTKATVSPRLTRPARLSPKSTKRASLGPIEDGEESIVIVPGMKGPLTKEIVLQNSNGLLATVNYSLSASSGIGNREVSYNDVSMVPLVYVNDTALNILTGPSDLAIYGDGGEPGMWWVYLINWDKVGIDSAYYYINVHLPTLAHLLSSPKCLVILILTLNAVGQIFNIKYQPKVQMIRYLGRMGADGSYKEANIAKCINSEPAKIEDGSGGMVNIQKVFNVILKWWMAGSNTVADQAGDFTCDINCDVKTFKAFLVKQLFEDLDRDSLKPWFKRPKKDWNDSGYLRPDALPNGLSGNEAGPYREVCEILEKYGNAFRTVNALIATTDESWFVYILRIHVNFLAVYLVYWLVSLLIIFPLASKEGDGAKKIRDHYVNLPSIFGMLVQSFGNYIFGFVEVLMQGPKSFWGYVKECARSTGAKRYLKRINSIHGSSWHLFLIMYVLSMASAVFIRLGGFGNYANFPGWAMWFKYHYNCTYGQVPLVKWVKKCVFTLFYILIIFGVLSIFNYPDIWWSVLGIDFQFVLVPEVGNWKSHSKSLDKYLNIPLTSSAGSIYVLLFLEIAGWATNKDFGKKLAHLAKNCDSSFLLDRIVQAFVLKDEDSPVLSTNISIAGKPVGSLDNRYLVLETVDAYDDYDTSEYKDALRFYEYCQSRKYIPATSGMSWFDDKMRLCYNIALFLYKYSIVTVPAFFVCGYAIIWKFKYMTGYTRIQIVNRVEYYLLGIPIDDNSQIDTSSLEVQFVVDSLLCQRLNEISRLYKDEIEGITYDMKTKDDLYNIGDKVQPSQVGIPKSSKEFWIAVSKVIISLFLSAILYSLQYLMIHMVLAFDFEDSKVEARYEEVLLYTRKLRVFITKIMFNTFENWIFSIVAYKYSGNDQDYDNVSLYEYTNMYLFTVIVISYFLFKQIVSLDLSVILMLYISYVILSSLGFIQQELNPQYRDSDLVKVFILLVNILMTSLYCLFGIFSIWSLIATLSYRDELEYKEYLDEHTLLKWGQYCFIEYPLATFRNDLWKRAAFLFWWPLDGSPRFFAWIPEFLKDEFLHFESSAFSSLVLLFYSSRLHADLFMVD